jgi:hypothetical protein
MRDMLIAMLVLACIIIGLYASHIWIPEAIKHWRPKCWPRCPQWAMRHTFRQIYRCVKCGWTQRLDATPIYYKNE